MDCTGKQVETVIIGSIEFIVYRPEKAADVPAVTINAGGTVTMNMRLRNELGSMVVLAGTADGQKVALRTAENEKACKIPKSCAIKAQKFVQALASAGVSFPARYTFEQVSDYWVGSLAPIQEVRPKSGVAEQKPRKKGLKDMLPKEGALS